MSTQTTQNTQNYNTTGFPATTIPWDNIHEPGTYVCNWSGHLLRIPEDGVVSGRSPVINMVGFSPMFVTKISDDPYIPLTKARLLSSNYDIKVNF
ncbi:MAG: hypothetical protein KAV82_08335 [Phycisphaerae bacterium]|nr:hypothetical protein [Phycisphaerae bacterium]